MYTYYIAGENLGLAEAELNGFLQSQNIDEKPERDNRLCLTEAEPTALKRLALTHEVGKLLDIKNDWTNLEAANKKENTYCVRAENLAKNKLGMDKEEIEKEIGSMLQTENNSVDLENPDLMFKVYFTGDKYYLTRTVQNIDRNLFDERVNQKRPFASPISMDPVLARVLVNLSGVSAGENVLDPLCGTGGILIEAGLCGIGVYGLDMQEEMVEGTKENLEKYGIINHDIRKGRLEDIENIFDKEFNAVVTDLPYGKASKIKDDVVEDFLSFIQGKENVVFVFNEPEIDGLESDFEVYIHKNLTRYIYQV